MAGAKKPPGRPPTFTHDVAWRVIGLLTAGSTVKDAAAEVGVTPRAIQLWRARAYSSRQEDATFVAFEQSLQRGLLAAAKAGQPGPPTLVPFSQLLADLDDGF